MLVAAAAHTTIGDHSTIIVKRTPFTPAEVDRFLRRPRAQLPDCTPIARARARRTATGHREPSSRRGSDAEVHDDRRRLRRKTSRAVSDDAPFFWHFSRFGDVAAPHRRAARTPTIPRTSSASACCCSCSAIAILYAAVFLLAPFFFVRKRWRALPAKGTSAVYFAALGLGFMFFEITMIQRLVQFLGYPTYSLTVTLAAMLVSTGIGALLEPAVRRPTRAGDAGRPRRARRRSRCSTSSRSRPSSPARCSRPGLGVRVAVRGRGARAARPVPRHVHAARPRRVATLTEPRRGVRRVGVGRERLLLGDRVGAHDDPVDDARLPRSCSSALGVYAIAAFAFTRLPSAIASRRAGLTRRGAPIEPVAV